MSLQPLPSRSRRISPTPPAPGAAAAPGRPATGRLLADTSTGEVLVLRDRAPAPRHGEPFTILFQQELLAVICSPAGATLTSLQLRVLLTIWSLVGYDNHMVLNISDLARRLGSQRASVSRAVAALQRHGLVRVPEAGPGGVRELRVNPHITFRGRVGERRAAVTRDVWAPRGAEVAKRP